MKRIALIAAGLVLVLVLAVAGCSISGGRPRQAAAPKPAGGPFMESAEVQGQKITLMAEPLKAGDNRLVVTVDDGKAAAVEAALIMSTMGHGTVLDLTRSGPETWEVKTAAMGMDGRWLARIRVTPEGGGEPRDALFWLDIKE